jgi:hypothetical protein
MLPLAPPVVPSAAGAPSARRAAVADDAETGRSAEDKRADRNFSDLLEELRVAQTGVQILVAFLLVIPFPAGASRLTGSLRYLYEGTLSVAVLAGVLLIAPVPFHRVVFRGHLKEPLVEASHRLAVCGLALLAVALVGSITLALATVSGWTLAVSMATVVAGVILFTWTLWPLRLRALHQRGVAGR